MQRGPGARLLDERAAGLAQWVADDVHRCLALYLQLLVQGNVRHLLAGVEERVLAALGEYVLRRANHDSCTVMVDFSRQHCLCTLCCPATQSARQSAVYHAMNGTSGRQLKRRIAVAQCCLTSPSADRR